MEVLVVCCWVNCVDRCRGGVVFLFGLVGFIGSLWLCLCRLHIHGHRMSCRYIAYISSAPDGEPSEEWFHEYRE